MTRLCLIPAYNTAALVAKVVRAAKPFCDHIVVVDDGSSDGTLESATSAGASVIRLGQNRGKGAALRAGLEDVKARTSHVIVMLDADGEHDPRDIPALCHPIETGVCEYTTGTRAVSRSRLALAGTGLEPYVADWFGVDTPDPTSGFRAFSNQVVSEMALFSQGFGIDVELSVRAALSCHRGRAVPIRNSASPKAIEFDAPMLLDFFATVLRLLEENELPASSRVKEYAQALENRAPVVTLHEHNEVSLFRDPTRDVYRISSEPTAI